jgi:hypothetical protein
MTTRLYQTTVTGRDAYHDAPLTNVAIKAFAGTDEFLALRVAPGVDVGKQSGRYFVLDRDSWLLSPPTFRAPKTSPRRIEWKVSSDSYFADNYALAGENALEDLANADQALRLRENTTQLITEALLRDLEVRVAGLVTSISNVGSGVTLTGAARWGDFIGSNPVADVTTAHAFIRGRTGLVANTLIIDEDTYQIVRRHPLLLDMYKYTRGGMLRDDDLRDVFQVENLWRGRGIRNVAAEGAPASLVNIWGNNALLARIVPGVSLQTETLALSFQWTPEGVPGPMIVERYLDPDPGKKVEVVAAGYYQDERIVARDLGYLIAGTL